MVRHIVSMFYYLYNMMATREDGDLETSKEVKTPFKFLKLLLNNIRVLAYAIKAPGENIIIL